jgi:AraC-like DNA-binding protein
MNYQTFEPCSNLKSLIKCYRTLEVPAMADPPRQRIIPDGCIEMAFILGDDIRRYTSENGYILQPRAMVLGQILEPFFIQPSGYVDTFAVRFYPYGFANFVKTPIRDLANKETPLQELFEKQSVLELERKIVHAAGAEERIKVVEQFFMSLLHEKTIIDNIVKTTVDALISTKGAASISDILKDDLSKRRQLERKFSEQIGISPKQLGKIMRLQSALKMLLNQSDDTFTGIAYDSAYYDQAHFIKDFREFTGTNPKEFFTDEQLTLSSVIYGRD